MARFVNLTPHAVTLCHPDGTPFLTTPPSPVPARCAASETLVATVPAGRDSVEVVRAVFGATEGLPAKEPGVLLIVSRLVAEANRDRADLVVPHDTVRDAQGRIVGCRRFATVADLG